MTVFVAGVVRGYSGFGFAMVGVTGMSLVLPPVQVVPAVLILSVLASFQLLPQVWSQINWKSLWCITAGSAAAIPLGVLILAELPAQPMRIAVSLLVLTAALLMLRGFAWRRMPGCTFALGVGVFCGLFNGAAAIGGPPAILFYLSSPAAVSVSRASIIAFFFGIDTLTLCVSVMHGIVTLQTFTLAGLGLLPMVAGIAIGSRMFKRIDPLAFRRHVLILLMLLAAASLARSFI